MILVRCGLVDADAAGASPAATACFAVSGGCTLASLKQEILHYFPGQLHSEDSFVIHYRDDENDFVRIGSEHDIVEAFSHVTVNGLDNILEVRVSATKKSPSATTVEQQLRVRIGELEHTVQRLTLELAHERELRKSASEHCAKADFSGNTPLLPLSVSTGTNTPVAVAVASSTNTLPPPACVAAATNTSVAVASSTNTLPPPACVAAATNTMPMLAVTVATNTPVPDVASTNTLSSLAAVAVASDLPLPTAAVTIPEKVEAPADPAPCASPVASMLDAALEAAVSLVDAAVDAAAATVDVIAPEPIVELVDEADRVRPAATEPLLQRAGGFFASAVAAVEGGVSKLLHSLDHTPPQLTAEQLESQLSEMAAMGFENIDLNVQLLQKYKGSVEHAVNELCTRAEVDEERAKKEQQEQRQGQQPQQGLQPESQQQHVQLEELVENQ